MTPYLNLSSYWDVQDARSLPTSTPSTTYFKLTHVAALTLMLVHKRDLRLNGPILDRRDVTDSLRLILHSRDHGPYHIVWRNLHRCPLLHRLARLHHKKK
jgi:hypothetical protein